MPSEASAASQEAQSTVVPSDFTRYSFVSVKPEEEVGSCDRETTVSSSDGAKVTISIPVSGTVGMYLKRLIEGSGPPPGAGTRDRGGVIGKAEENQKKLVIAYNMLIEKYEESLAGTALSTSDPPTLAPPGALMKGQDLYDAVNETLLLKGWNRS